MQAEKMEVFCMNLECGDPEVHTGALSHLESRKYRRMNYMGSRVINPAKAIAKTLLKKPSVPRGKYHFFSCPVCGSKRVFLERKGLVVEMDKETASLIAA